MERTIGDGRVRNTGYDYEQTDGFGNTTRTTYDNFGRVTSTIDALGYATTSGYDALGRQTSVTDPLTNAVTTAYDADGRVVAQRGATYPVDYFYDEFGEKVSMTTYRDLNEGTGNGEQGTGNGAVQGDVTRWLRDEATGLITNKVYADGKGPRYDYTPDGKLATRTWARGIVTTYSYDDNGSLTNTVYSDGTPTISLAYNRAGRQIQAIDAAGVTTFAYDDFGAVTNETVVGVAGTNTIERFYDTFGRDSGYALNGIRQSTLGYDPATGRLASMQIPAIEDEQNHCPPPPLFSTFHWTYLPGSDLKQSLAYPNGLNASWQYDANNQLLQVCNATPTNTISQYDYAYDAAGRRVQIARSGSAMSENRTDVHGYNSRGELTSAVKQGAVPEAEYAYEYDDIGNRLTSLDLGTNRTYVANNLNQYTQISNLCDSASLREEFLPQFDDDGNQTLIKTATGIWQVQYNGENRPVLWEKVTANSPTPNSSTPTLLFMSYDRMGRRITKNAMRFVYDGCLQIANFEHLTSNIKHQTFIWDPTEAVATRPLVWNSSTFSTSCYTHDGNKNVSEIVASSGDISAHYEYAPFGAWVLSVGDYASDNPWRFSSEFADDDMTMVYYNFRHYDPNVGRWIARDPLEYLFPYSYVRNRVSGYDYLGYKGLLPEFSSEEKKRILEIYVANIKNFISEGNEEEAARVAYFMYSMMMIGGAKEEPLASEFMMLWLSGSMKNKTYTMKADDVMKIVTDDKKGPNDEPSVRDALKRDLCPLMKGKGINKGRLEDASSSPYIYTDPYYHAIGGFNLKINAEFSSTDCCVYKIVGDWNFSDTYDWHAGKPADVMGVEILDDWAILVQKYRKELAVWLGDPKLDLAHPFEEKGTWNGEVTVDCCDKGKGGDK